MWAAHCPTTCGVDLVRFWCSTGTSLWPSGAWNQCGTRRHLNQVCPPWVNASSRTGSLLFRHSIGERTSADLTVYSPSWLRHWQLHPPIDQQLCGEGVQAITPYTWLRCSGSAVYLVYAPDELISNPHEPRYPNTATGRLPCPSRIPQRAS
jgi:hypothetical protein